MPSPTAPGSGSTGDFPSDRRGADGSSIVNLIAPSRLGPDDRPTVIGGSPPPATQLLAGQKLGHFELIDTIGRGGMATVLKARDLELGRIVALKILPPETASDPESVSRFKQEARSAARLDSDHIARVYFCGEDRGLHFIAFEFVAGENLRVVMQPNRLSPALAVRYLLHVTQGLQHAAERGVVHRDIKPSNILITPESQAKIVDMGLARHHTTAGGVTQSGVTLGTFDYISPEQALDPRRADLRSDIYSLGCTFYHALTGQPAVPDGTAAKKLQAHQHEAPLDPRDLNPAVPDPLAAVLAKMMAKDPARRYQTAAELIDDLHAVAAACGYSSEVPEGVSVKAAPTLDPPWSTLPIAWVLAASAAAIALAIIFGRPAPTKTPTTPPWGEYTLANKGTTPDVSTSAPAAVVGTMKAVVTVPQLVEALSADDAVTVKLKPGTIYDIRTLANGIAFHGTSLVIEADGPGPPPLLRLHAGSEDRSLTLHGCRTVTFRGLDFDIGDRPAEDALPMPDDSAVAFEGVARIAIQGCRVVATGTSESAGFSVNPTPTSELTVQNSLFNLGSLRMAFSLDPSVRAEFQDCAFGPHAAAIRIADEATTTPGDVKLSSCTFMLDQGCAVLVDTIVATKINAGYCLFAAADMKATDGMPAEPVPVVRVSVENSEAQFQSIANQTNGYWGVAPLANIAKTFTFTAVPSASFRDATARILTRSPWAASDPRLLLGGSEPAAAFRLALTDSRLRLPPVTAAVILGAKSLGETRIYPGPWPPERALSVKAANNERIVWPDADAEDASARLYPSFAAGFAALQPGETLSLAVNGLVPLPLLAERTLKATIRAATSFKPVLVADGPVFTTDSSLFRLADGELTFEGLEIRLKDRQAIVQVAAGTSCTFRRCVLTLSEKDDVPAAAVVIPDPVREMKMPLGSDQTPRVQFTDTIIRGEGKAVWVQTARSFEVIFDNTAVALNGNVLRLDATDKPLAGETPKGRLHLKRSTLVLAEALVDVKAGRGTGGTPAFLSVESEACLFASADSRATAVPLVLLDDVEPLAELAKYFSWSGRGSVYSYSESSAAVEFRGGAAGANWDWPQWLRFTRDDGKHVPKIRFAKTSLKSKLATVDAADFALSIANPLEAGVDVEKLP